MARSGGAAVVCANVVVVAVTGIQALHAGIGVLVALLARASHATALARPARTRVRRGAEQPIVAGYGVVYMLACPARARIGCTDIIVVALRDGKTFHAGIGRFIALLAWTRIAGTYARTPGAAIRRRAEEPVIARRKVVGNLANAADARVIRADVAVIAVRRVQALHARIRCLVALLSRTPRAASGTRPAGANVRKRAEEPVVARRGIVGEGAYPAHACVRGATITIGAARIVVRVHARIVGLVARIIRAGECVGAVGGSARPAAQVYVTCLHAVAKQTIVACRSDRNMIAFRILFVACVGRAGNSVIAIHRCTRAAAERRMTGFGPVAIKPVVANRVIQIVLACAIDADVVGAGNGIRAVHLRAPACTRGAGVARRTGVAVVACAGIVGVLTTRQGVTCVGRATVIVIAIPE